jgi:hypothetical protein
MQLSYREDFADFLQTGFVEKRAKASKGRPFGGARRVQKLPFGALSLVGRPPRAPALTVARGVSGLMSFSCFVPGLPIINASAFRQVDTNRWVIEVTNATPINELACFISQPLPPGMALGCHIASAPFEKWHYLGPVTSEAPSALFKTRYVWTAGDAMPTTVQFGVSLEPTASLAALPAERVSAEVLEAGRRIGQDLYNYLTSFAVTVNLAGELKVEMPLNTLERWLQRFREKCQRQGLDWLAGVDG